jgi:hypothetical protein
MMAVAWAPVAGAASAPIVAHPVMVAPLAAACPGVCIISFVIRPGVT